MRSFHKSSRCELWLAEIGAPGETDAISEALPDIDLVYSSPPSREFYHHWNATAPFGDVVDGLIQLLRDIDAETVVIDGFSICPAISAALGQEWPHVATRPIVYEAPTTANGRGCAKKPGFVQLVLSREKLDVWPVLGLGSREALAGFVDDLPAGSTVFDPFTGKGLAMQVAVAAGHRFYGTDSDSTRLESCVGWINTKDQQS